MRTVLFALALTSSACVDLDDTELSDPELSDTDLSKTEQALLPQYSLVDTSVSSTGADALVRADCPANTVVLGSSWRATDAAGTTIDSVVASASALGAPPFGSPVGTSWLFLAHSLTGAPYTVRVRLVCAAAPAGYQFVTSTSPPTNSSSAFALATCPGGKRVTGGGYVIADSANRAIAGEPTAFLPSIDGSSWFVSATPPRGTPNWTLTTFGLCANLDALPGYQVISAQTSISGGGKQLVTACPKSTAMTGAGWAARDTNNAINNGRATMHDIDASGRTVQTNAQYRTQSKWSLEQRVICVN
jgi:hypothetical protein